MKNVFFIFFQNIFSVVYIYAQNAVKFCCFDDKLKVVQEWLNQIYVSSL